MLLANISKSMVVLSVLAPCAVGAQNVAVLKDQIALMEDAKSGHAAGIARKTKQVDARPAKPGEIVITFINGQGVETRSKPAEEGDWVVRNRCEETGNEEILVKSARFPERYGKPLSEADKYGYQAFKPIGSDMNYFIVPEEMGFFYFMAPWGERMIASPGDAIVQVASDKSDTYRVAEAAFKCTYEIVTPAKS